MDGSVPEDIGRKAFSGNSYIHTDWPFKRIMLIFTLKPLQKKCFKVNT